MKNEKDLCFFEFCEDNWPLMENKDVTNQELHPVEIEENQSYLLNYEKNNLKEDLIVLILSSFLIIAHILNCFFNPSINYNHTQNRYTIILKFQ